MSVSYRIVILNWNGVSDTLACLQRLFESNVLADAIVVVDNGSTDDSVKQIRHAYPEVKLMETGSNLGYSPGNNYALRRLPKEVEFGLILNNDCQIDKTSIEEMVKLAKSNPQIGIVTPKVYRHDRVLLHAGSLIDWGSWFITRGRGTNDEDIGQYEKTEPVGMAPGDCMLVRMSALQQVGFIPEEYFLYYEDAALSLNLRRAGYVIMYCPSAVAYHEESRSSGGINRPTGAYYVLRNKFYFARRYGSAMARLKSSIHFGLSLAKNGSYFIIGRNRPVSRVRCLALFDAARGHMGYRSI